MIQISAHVDRGPGGGSRLCRPGCEDPHWRELKLFEKILSFDLFALNYTFHFSALVEIFSDICSPELLSEK